MRRLFICFCFFGTFSTLQVLQVTDFHYDADYSIDGDPQKMCHSGKKTQNSDEKKLGSFGDYMCDSPELLVNYIVSEAKRLVPNPDLILWTGDNTPHIEDYNMDYVFNGLSRTTQILFKTYDKTPILPTFGNHDYAPSNDFIEESSLYGQVYDKLWTNNVGAENREIFMKGGYYKYRIPNTKQLVLVLNTNLYYGFNKAIVNFSNPMDPAEQFKFMQDTLEDARTCSKIENNGKFGAADCSKIVHIVAHLGPGAFERTPNITWMTPYYNNRFLSIVEKYSANIGWMIFGHHHTDTFHVVRDYMGNPINVAWMSPAVTPWFSSLDGAGSNNPTFRVYQTDDMTGEILDFTTYSLNLDKLNQNGNESATVEYSMKNDYALNSLHPKEISDLVDRFDKDGNLFMKYINYNSAGWDPKLPETKYRQAQLCSMRFADYERYFTCMEATVNEETATKGAKMFTVSSIFLIYFIYRFLL